MDGKERETSINFFPEFLGLKKYWMSRETSLQKERFAKF